MASEKVVRSYLWIAGLYTLSASLIWGVNTLFLLDAGLSIFQVFIANSVFTGAMSLFEIPTGVLADTSGRRISFLLSVAVLAVGTLGYVGVAQYGGGLAWFCIMSVVLGLGYTFYSGAVEAWLVDALKATNYDGQLEHVFSRGGMVTGAMMLVGTVGGGLLGDIDLAVPFFVRAVLLSLLFVLAFFNMRDIGYEPRALKLARIPAEMKILAQASLKYGWNKPELRMLMLAGLIQFGFSAWGFYAWQPYFLELLGRDAVWVAGVVAALIAVAMMTGNALVSWLTRFCGKRTTLLLWAAGTFSAASVGVGLTGSFWVAVGLFVLSMLASGISTPVRQAYIHEVIPSDQRATIISLDSMVVSGGS
ncbi:MAG: MFS transporter, partial [Anaerolineae bacterium]|nr:MFS transporter [Anaerolineae bacterium]